MVVVSVLRGLMIFLSCVSQYNDDALDTLTVAWKSLFASDLSRITTDEISRSVGDSHVYCILVIFISVWWAVPGPFSIRSYLL